MGKKRGVVTYVNEKFTTKLEFKDMEGRYVAVMLEIDCQNILICNLYAPNGSKSHFVKELKEKISNSKFDHLILVGDFNGVLDVNLDSSKTTKNKKYASSRVLPTNFLNLKKEFDLHDAWRCNNPNSLDYTFFSARHNSWARIDMFWISSSLITKIQEIKIHPRDKSDHCPLTMNLNKKRNHFKWRLDNNLLKLDEDIEKNRKLIKEFFELNDTEETTTQTLWDAFKAVTRGHLIQQKAEKNKRRYKEMFLIKKEIDRLEWNLKLNPQNKDVTLQLKKWNSKKNQLELETTAKQLKYIKQYNFENANKPGQWLSRKIRKRKQQQYITKIVKDGNPLVKDEKILETFREFYIKLYKEEEIDLDEISLYLGSFQLQKISDQQRELLNKEITIEEIKKALKMMKGNKAPGPDGYSIAFLKIFQNETLQYLKKVMNEVLQEKKIPESWTQAEIITIPKGKGDNTDIRNFRPISLLNSDYKIFTTILSNRFKEFLKNWIGPEQKGFLPARNSSENIRCMVDIIEYYEHHHEKELALLSVDAEKAFDNLNWSFFKLLFREINIGFNFYNAIDAIYNNQSAKIIIKGHHSKEFPIEKGVRQGCPLSPLIFIFAMEMLIKSIRNDKNLRGTRIKGHEYKIRAFADDVICIIEDPRQQIHNWITKIKQFGKLAGFKLNKIKTEMLTKNISKKNQIKLQETSGLKISQKLKYLGIWLIARNLHLLGNNYIKKWKEIQQDLKQWNYLNISLLERISLIKMSILPKLLFLFQNLPIIRNHNLFRKWNKELSKFIWKSKKPRIKYVILTDAKERGGFDLPNLSLYYEACALKWVKEWASLRDENLLTLESFDLRRGWHAYLWYGKRSIEKNFGNHFVRVALIRTWEKYKPFFYTKTPLWISPLEADVRHILNWKKWPSYKDILKKSNGTYYLKSQEEIKETFKNCSWFQYAQIKEKFNSDSKIGFSDLEGPWDKLLSSNKKEISKSYNILLSWSTEEVTVKQCMTSWARNIGRPINFSEWELVWKKKINYTYAWNLKENWLKIFHRWHMTPKKLHAMYKNYPNSCWKCKSQEGSFYHLWWSCPKIQKFWTIIHDKIQKILKFLMKPESYLLGILDTALNWELNDDKLYIQQLLPE
uniref:Reverse transcriptase domain-containing protein n=1 Tax=Anolis carolinensis TaxID=28377 RepID=A0A803TUI3_ANOCA